MLGRQAASATARTAPLASTATATLAPGGVGRARPWAEHRCHAQLPRQASIATSVALYVPAPSGGVSHFTRFWMASPAPVYISASSFDEHAYYSSIYYFPFPFCVRADEPRRNTNIYYFYIRNQNMISRSRTCKVALESS